MNDTLSHKQRRLDRYVIPLHDGYLATLMLPRPMRAKDIRLIRAWFDICEAELVEADADSEYEI